MKLKALILAASLVALPFTAHTQTLTNLGFDLPIHTGGHVRANPHGGYDYQWPGIYFEARFSGPQIMIEFEDPNSNFNIIVDGKPVMLLRKPGTFRYTIQDLAQAEHTIRVEKRSETQYATGRFMGFFVPDKSHVLPATAPARQIEFIGDSLTVGYGNTSAFTKCTVDEIFETTDAQQGFGPLTAKHFNADYQINAFSGLGIVRNFDGREHPKYHMPMLYDRAIFDDPTPVVQPNWHPQVIVIGIGGNDFSTPLHPDELWNTPGYLLADYVKTYTAFVKSVRARNPDAQIILATPPHRDDGYTGGTDEVFAAIKATGDTHIDRVILPELDDIGCNGHPSTRADARVAEFYIKYLENHPQVWQGS